MFGSESPPAEEKVLSEFPSIPLMRDVRRTLLEDSVVQWEFSLNRRHEFKLVYQAIGLCVS